MKKEKKIKILVADDECDLLDLLEYSLTKENFTVYTAKNGKECLDKLPKVKPDVVLLDVVMPILDGKDVCKRIRESETYRDIPVMMLTAKSMEKDIVEGLNLGADDYLTKPFSMKILVARLHSIIRRKIKGEFDNKIKVANIEIDSDSEEVFVDGEKIVLTYYRLNMLKLFLTNPNHVFSRRDLITQIKGDDYPVTDRAVDVHVVELRKQLKGYGAYIKSIRGIGYKFSLD